MKLSANTYNNTQQYIKEYNKINVPKYKRLEWCHIFIKKVMNLGVVFFFVCDGEKSVKKCLCCVMMGSDTIYKKIFEINLIWHYIIEMYRRPLSEINAGTHIIIMRAARCSKCMYVWESGMKTQKYFCCIKQYSCHHSRAWRYC